MNSLAWQRPTLTGHMFLPQVPMAPRYFMGQTASEWLTRAQRAVGRFDNLLVRTSQIANRTERDNILTWVGDPSNPVSPAYRRATVNQDLTQDVAREGVGAYNLARRQNRVVQLEEINSEFNDRVESAERVFGILPPTQVIERERIVERPGMPPVMAPAARPNLTVPLLIAGGGVALALLLGAI